MGRVSNLNCMVDRRVKSLDRGELITNYQTFCFKEINRLRRRAPGDLGYAERDDFIEEENHRAGDAACSRSH